MQIWKEGCVSIHLLHWRVQIWEIRFSVQTPNLAPWLWPCQGSGLQQKQGDARAGLILSALLSAKDVSCGLPLTGPLVFLHEGLGFVALITVLWLIQDAVGLNYSLAQRRLGFLGRLGCYNSRLFWEVSLSLMQDALKVFGKRREGSGLCEAQ